MSPALLTSRPALAWAVCQALLFGVLTAPAAPKEPTNLKTDEQILFVPGIGYWEPERRQWRLEIQGVVYELEERRAAVSLIEKIFEWDHARLSDQEHANLVERARLFLADRQSGKDLVVTVGTETVRCTKTGTDGWFHGTAWLDDAVAQELAVTAAGTRMLSYTAVLPKGDLRTFRGEVQLVGQQGSIIVSDIDDTIKITEVKSLSSTLRNTFLKPFEPVQGMAERYRSWGESPEIHFCYLSASPWQLFVPLNAFVRSSEFPAGSFHLRPLRWTDRSALDYLKGPTRYKTTVIEQLLREFPQRNFVLVGDSGEQDPEIYGELARLHVDRIAKVFIRSISSTQDARRYSRAFRDLTKAKWTVFQHPSELPEDLFQPSATPGR